MIITTGRWRRIVVAFLVAIALTAFSSVKLLAAAMPEDGEYTINYEILKGDPKDDSTSLANGYWNKPATVLVNNGAIVVRTVINKDAWVVEFSTKQGSNFVDAKVVSRDSENDSRLVEFKVSSLEQDLVTSMTVDIPEQNYSHSYETRFRFYPDTLELVKAVDNATSSPTKPVETSSPAASSGKVDDGKTSSNASNSDASAGNGNSTAPSNPDASSSKGDNAATGNPAATVSPDKEATTNGQNAGTRPNDDTSDHQASNTEPSSAVSGKADSSTDADDSSTNAAQLNPEAANSAQNASTEQADSAAAQETQGTEDESSNDEQTDAASESSAAELGSAAGNLEGEAVTTAANAVDEDGLQKSSLNPLLIILIIVALLIAGVIVWQVKYRKNKKQ